MAQFGHPLGTLLGVDLEMLIRHVCSLADLVLGFIEWQWDLLFFMTKSQIKLILGHLNLFGHVTVGELNVFTLAQLNHFFWYLKRNFEERNSPEAFNSGWEKEEVPSAAGNVSLCLPALIQSHSPRLQQLTQTLSCFLSSQPPPPLPPPREAKNQIPLPIPQLTLLLLHCAALQLISNIFPGWQFRPSPLWYPDDCWYSTSQHTGEDKRRHGGLRGQSQSNHGL